MFQSPKTGLCFSHSIAEEETENTTTGFNPLKRVYAFLTLDMQKG